MSEIRVIMCGDRHWTDLVTVDEVIRKLVAHYGIGRLLIISGGAPGADTMAIQAAHNQGVHCARVDALWHKHRTAAGPMRNAAMLKLRPHLIFAFHEDLSRSRGTRDMLAKGLRAGVRCIHVSRHVTGIPALKKRMRSA